MDKNETFNLVVVDMQYDFCDPEGTMYVDGASKLAEKIAQFIGINKYDRISNIIFTRDSHSLSHCSLQRNGGQWPNHCIAGTIGEGIPVNLIEACWFDNETYKPYSIFNKGEYNSSEEYGAFNSIITHNTDGRTWYSLEGHSSRIDIITNTNFVVIGLCGDYCVMETMKNLMQCKDFNVMTIPELVLSIDGGEKFEQFIKENNIKTIEKWMSK